MRVDKSKWETVPFTECVRNIKVKDAIQKKDYLPSGLFPIISQEKDFISGYTNDKISLNTDLGEVVIFGDHTRVLKFVDFDFCVGADGVKVLRPYGALDAKFLYYHLLWCDIPSNGYSRHFKFLKELQIKHPLIDEQYDIAAELDAVQEMIDVYKAQIADLNALAQSIFLDTFGDPIANPKGWNFEHISDFGKVLTGNTPSKAIEEYYNSKDVEWIKTDNILENIQTPSVAAEYLSKGGAKKARIVNADAILICCIAGSLKSIGRCCITDRTVAFNQQINAIECNDMHCSLFIYWLIKVSHKLFMDVASTGMKHILSKSVMSNISLPVPPFGLQQQFADQVEAIEKQKELLRQQLADAETLMAERMQHYFGDEPRRSDSSDSSDKSDSSDNSDSSEKSEYHIFPNLSKTSMS